MQNRNAIQLRNCVSFAAVGPSWEGMPIENILGALPATARTSFYRTSAGAEIDLVIEFSAKAALGHRDQTLARQPRTQQRLLQRL